MPSTLWLSGVPLVVIIALVFFTSSKRQIDPAIPFAGVGSLIEFSNEQRYQIARWRTSLFKNRNPYFH